MEWGGTAGTIAAILTWGNDDRCCHSRPHCVEGGPLMKPQPHRKQPPWRECWSDMNAANTLLWCRVDSPKNYGSPWAYAETVTMIKLFFHKCNVCRANEMFSTNSKRTLVSVHQKNQLRYCCTYATLTPTHIATFYTLILFHAHAYCHKGEIPIANSRQSHYTVMDKRPLANLEISAITLERNSIASAGYDWLWLQDGTGLAQLRHIQLTATFCIDTDGRFSAFSQRTKRR